MRRKLRSFLALAPADRRLALAAVATLFLTSLLLRRAGLRRTQLWLARLARRPEQLGGDEALALAHRCERAVRIAERNVPGRIRCLERSLALWTLLRRRGVAARLRLGVRRSPRDLEAHAWIEVAGVAVNDGDDVGRRFAPFDGEILPRPG